jgi:hypothetical protein
MNLSSGRRCIHGQSVSGFKYRVSRRNRDYFGKIRLILSAFACFCNIAKIRVPIFGYDSKFTFLTCQHIIKEQVEVATHYICKRCISAISERFIK